MHPYQLKSATKELNGEPLEGYGVYCGDELRFFAHAFDYRWVRDFVNHINEAFYIFENYMKEIQIPCFDCGTDFSKIELAAGSEFWLKNPDGSKTKYKVQK